mmetsp:Transcript_43108/g.68894  ORF Transcript_43108/g.68894 Transcript_43108/m.68894 type:complete len:80 (-) Transcript_43108:677-916(-)
MLLGKVPQETLQQVHAQSSLRQIFIERYVPRSPSDCEGASACSIDASIDPLRDKSDPSSEKTSSMFAPACSARKSNNAA